MLRNFFDRESGQASLEYVLIFTFVAMFLVGGFVLLAFAKPALLP